MEIKTEYLKIPTVNKRAEDGTKKLIENEWRDETLQYLSSLPFYWQEKIDGTNIRVIWDGFKIFFGGRTDRASIPSTLMDRLIELFQNPETEQLFEQKFGNNTFVLYGEGFGEKIQSNGSGGNYIEGTDFALFDVYCPDQGLWLTRDSVHDIAVTFGLREPDIIDICMIDKAIEYVKNKPKSHIGTADMEGLVGRPLYELKDRRGNRIIVKVKVRDYT